jgi:hypothetical protein
LRRAATFLRKIGIAIEFLREGAARTRIIRISTIEPSPLETVGNFATVASVAPAPSQKPNVVNGFSADANVDANAGADANTDGTDANGAPTVRATVRAKVLKINGADCADDADANFLQCSAPEKEGGGAKGTAGEDSTSLFPVGRCAQCNGQEADAPLVTGQGYPPAGVHLHPQCRRFWVPPSSGIPFVITHPMRVRLRERGYSDDRIAALTPVEAHAVLNGNGRGQEGKEPYTVLGSAPAGERCTLCGKGSNVKQIRYRGGVDLWHQDCADKHVAVLTSPPIKIPDLGPDPLDEHGAPHEDHGGEQ